MLTRYKLASFFLSVIIIYLIICEKYYEYAHVDPLYFLQRKLFCWMGRRVHWKIDERFKDAGEFEEFLESF